MSEEMKQFYESVQDALRHEPDRWTPDCPEPETLLDWAERGDTHPEATPLLDHLMACGFCRRAYTLMCETRTSARVPAPQRHPPRLSKLRAWANELVTDGIATPIRALRTALQTMDRLASSSAPALMRAIHAPSDLRPAWTAVRTQTPALRWSADHPAREYIVLVTPHTGRKPRQPVWEGSAGSERHLTLPEQAGLEPGGLYLWQVIARAAGDETVCPPVCFCVLTDPARRQMEALEAQTEDGTLERVALLEAFGLYDEALQQIEAMIGRRPEDITLESVRAKLLDRVPK